MSTLPANCFVLNHFYIAMEARIDTMLYKEESGTAWRLVQSSWPALATSKLLRVQIVSIMAFHLRARAALAAGWAAPRDARTYLKDVRRCVRRIERERAPWGNMLALTVRAGVAGLEGRRNATLDLLAKAETQAQTVQMSLYVAACQYVRGTLIGGSEGLALVSASEAWAALEGVVKPSRMFNTIMPWRL
jgi:hypothetical protein